MDVIATMLTATLEKEDPVSSTKAILDEFGPARVLRSLERMARKEGFRSPVFQRVVRNLSWALGFREQVPGKPYINLLCAQPFVLEFKKLDQPVSSKLPVAVRKLMYGLYGLSEDTPLRYGDALLSPRDVPLHDAREVAKLLQHESPDVPFTVGTHLRFVPVFVQLYHLDDLQISNPRPLTQLLKLHYKASAVFVFHPVEVFTLNILVDFLNNPKAYMRK